MTPCLKLYQLHGTQQIGDLKQSILRWKHAFKLGVRQHDGKHGSQNAVQFDLSVIIIDNNSFIPLKKRKIVA